MDITVALDRLVAPVLPPKDFVYTGYGRDLVPFFAEDIPVKMEARFLQPLEGRKGSLKAAPKPKRRQTEKPVKGRSSPSSPSNRGRGAIQANTDGSYYAGPGFQSSPKPEALPMPTLSLIQRAVGARAGYMSNNFVVTSVQVAAA